MQPCPVLEFSPNNFNTPFAIAGKLKIIRKNMIPITSHIFDSP